VTKHYHWISALLLGLYASSSWCVEDGPEIDVDFHQLATGYAHLVSFTAEPEIAAGRYTIDGEDSASGDSTLKTTKLPLYREFTSDNHSWSWYLQGALNYSSLEQKVHYGLDPPLEGSSTLEWTGYGALLESGIILPLSEGLSWTTGLGFGVSRLENKARFSNPQLKELLDPVLDGTMYDWETNVATTRGNLGLLYDKEHGKYGIKANAHFTYSYIDSFGESRKFGGFSGHASTLTLKLDVRHSLGAELRGHPVYIIGHLGNTNFIGANRGELGFDSFSELGLSFGIQKVTLGALAVFSNDVNGWNLILNYDY